MQLVEQKSTQPLQLPAPSTPMEQIETSIRNGSINQRAATVLLELHNKDKLLQDPAAIERHARITESVASLASSLGNSSRLH